MGAEPESFQNPRASIRGNVTQTLGPEDIKSSKPVEFSMDRKWPPETASLESEAIPLLRANVVRQ